jgi:uncharacterized membrane protein YdjX (TVP38/TMEM64 family)
MDDVASRNYLIPALLVFLVAVTGSDLFARMTIGGQHFRDAIGTHLQWAVFTIPGILFLFVPFAGIALICGVATRRTRSRRITALFCISVTILACFYFAGFQAAQRGPMEDGWAAATPWFGPLPFFIGIPILAVVAIVAAVLARLDPRRAR